MTTPERSKDESLEALTLPLKSIGASEVISADAIMGEDKIFGAGRCITEPRSRKSVVECSFVDLGRVTILSGRTTPVHAWEQDAGKSSITMCYSGSPSYHDTDGRIKITPGDILANPRSGGKVSTGYLSSINFSIDHLRMSRTMRAMQCTDNSRMLQQRLAFQGTDSRGSRHNLLFEFFTFVDSLLAESRYICGALGLDENIYRLLALAIDAKAGLNDKRDRRWKSRDDRWSSPLDELVDYIQCNAHLIITLTDLEERSNYSARRLQYLFQEKFDCSPMQFVRRQRLSTAMEKLRTAEWGDTVTSIGRDCGYRFTSNFSSDFHREFGVAPSVVLRASQTPGHKV